MVAILNLSFLLISVLLSVAFITLAERKLLSYMQTRKGPNKLGYAGVLQPFGDAVKLLFKGSGSPSSGNFALFWFSPSLTLLIMLLMWLAFPSYFGLAEPSLPLIYLLCCLSGSVYPILGSGWASNSKYPLFGSLRAVAQTISYEVSFALLLLSLVVLNASFSLESFFPPFNQWNLLLAPLVGGVWLTSALAESNRSPFDFSEGESELVSGFNTEFSASPFATFFLSEYGSVLFMSFFFTVLFLHPTQYGLGNSIKTSLLIFLFIWIRATVPRLRYDKLMMLAWKLFLPFTLFTLLFCLSMN